MFILTKGNMKAPGGAAWIHRHCKEIKMIKEFKGEYGFLSNFWKAPVEYEGGLYPTVEHAFQAAKTLSGKQRANIMMCGSPGESKEMGRKVTLRTDWEKVKVGIMNDILRDKFTRHKGLRKKLLDTKGKKLQEGNTWDDRFWGVCLKTGVGENYLGKLLMDLREELQA